MTIRKKTRKTTKTRRRSRVPTREEIDASFAAMGKDPHYAEISALIDKEFATADWEALKLADRSYPTKVPSRLSRSR
jgi:hypothetical protein